MANDQKRMDAPNMPLMYVLKSALTTCAALAAAKGDDARAGFLGLIRREGLLEPRRCSAGSQPANGWASRTTRPAWWWRPLSG